ncbi:MAG: DUF4126 domain-containing protein [Bacteroidales bacterium]|nr:DUF4126 domain-containing protein [Bacteroidales bacterium]
MDKEILIAIAMGIGLSASCGFRVFVPMLIASIAAKTGIFPLNEGFQWLSGWPAIISFGTASIVEILAYYIPLIDNLLDTITTPLAVGAGTLLLTSVLPVDSDFLKWVTGFIFGGGTAAAVQSGTALTRLASTKFTAGAGNAVVATGEHAAAFGTSVLSLFIPFIIATLIIVLIIFIFMKFGKKVFKKRV